jgi:archaellum component FlaC
VSKATMDAVEGVEAISDLFKLSLELCVTLGHYFKDVKKAPSHIQRLRNELEKLKFLANVLSDSFIKAESQNLQIAYDEQIRELRSTLQELEKRTAESNARGRKRWKWPLHEAETEEYIQKLGMIMARLNVVTSTNQTFGP